MLPTPILNTLARRAAPYFLIVLSSAVLAESRSDVAALTPAELRHAIAGEKFAYRGQFREGAAARAFAEGYVFALAERSAQHGDWCGFEALLPHELIAQVFESLSVSEPADIENIASSTQLAVNKATATQHVENFLQTRFPCNLGSRN